MHPVSVASIALPLADANHHTFSSDLFAPSANNWRRGRKRITYKPKGKESCFGEEDRKMKIVWGVALSNVVVVVVLTAVTDMTRLVQRRSQNPACQQLMS